MDEKGRFAPVGQGTIDFGRILAKKERSGMKAYFVEQDVTIHMKPLEAIKVSHEGLKKFGFN
jgi:sugar phosphate isomerase/epimerase